MIVLFVLAGVFAVGDWIARTRDNRRLEYLCKPATLALLIAAALTLDPVANAHTRRSWFVIALVFSLLGDVLLMLPQDLFLGGLAAFLVGHLAYVAGFWSHGPSGIAFMIAALIVIAAVAPLARRILRSLKTEPNLRGPVATYIVVISAMVASALATGNVLAGSGAVLFATSDSMIAWNRFVGRFRAAEVVIMVTYHLGQGLLVASLLR